MAYAYPDDFNTKLAEIIGFKNEHVTQGRV